MRAAVVIPVFDRLRSLETVLKSCNPQRSKEDVEVIVVDDKSPYGQEIKKRCSRFNARYVRNDTRNIQERQPALCRNLGYLNSSAEIVIFLDADVVISPGAIETHLAYHRVPNVVVDGQIWSIPGGQNSVDTLTQLSEDDLVMLSKWLPHAEVPWSRLENVHLSNNWWAFLSGHCSFKRVDLDNIGGWDDGYTGWGVEDNDLAYSFHSRSYSFIYAEDLKSFHIDHAMTQKEYVAKCASALRNLKQFNLKFPEVAQDPRIRARMRELELVFAGGGSPRSRQETAGGGIITDSDFP